MYIIIQFVKIQLISKVLNTFTMMKQIVQSFIGIVVIITNTLQLIYQNFNIIQNNLMLVC